MTRLQIDVPLLRKALEHITEHPEEWKQGFWVTKYDCGTVYCLAGHVAIMTGHEIDWGSEAWRFAPDREATLASGVVGGQYISDVAREALGLSRDHAETLFCGSNTLPELWELAHSYTNGEIEIPEQFL